MAVIRYGLPWITALLILSLWGLLSLRYPPVLLPSPAEVLTATWASRTALLTATLWTTVAALSGLTIAGIFGFIGAIAFQRAKWLETALYPWALLIQTVPIVAIAPLLVIWLGYGLGVAIASAAIVSFFPILTSTHSGLKAAPQEQVELFDLYRAGWWLTLRHLRIPGALPFVFTGLRTAGGLAVIGAIVGEFVGSNGSPSSLGYLVLRSARSADTDLTFGAVAFTTILALCVFGFVKTIERRMIGHWHGHPQQ